MKKSFLAALSILLIGALVVDGCKKSDNPVSGDKPPIPVFTWSVPAVDTTMCGLTAYSSVVEVQAMTTLTNAFAALPATDNNGTWTWNAPQDGVNYTLTATPSQSGYQWVLKGNGTDTQTQVNYSDFTFFSGTTSADGSTGDLTIYDDSNPGTPTILGKFSWTISGTTVNATFESYQNGAEYAKVDIVSTVGAGGSVTIYPWTGSAYSTTPNYHGTWSAPSGTVTCG